MKPGEQAQFSAKWWKDSQPKGLTSAHRLEDAFRHFEAAKHTLETHHTDAAVRAALGSLTAIEAAIKATVSEAARTKSPEMDATVKALRQLDVQQERTEISSHSASEDGDDDQPFSEAAYPGYLLKNLRRLRTVPMNFGLVLGGKPDQHRLSLHRVTGPMTLGHHLMRDTGLHLMTFGTVRADEDRDRTILLTFEGRQLPAVKKKLERMLRIRRPLPFQYIALFSGSAEIEDVDDPDDHEIDLDFDDDAAVPHEADLRAEIMRIRPRLSAAMAGSAQTRTTILATVKRFAARLKAGDLAGARAGLISLHALIPGEGLQRPDKDSGGS